MPYVLTMAASFVTELAQCAAYVGQRMTKINQELEENPFTETNEGNIKKLAGFDTLYRYRVGDYRVIYAVQGDQVRLLMAGKRADIYDRLDNYDPDAPDEARAQRIEAQLLPDSEAARRQREVERWDAFAAAQVAQEEARKDRPLAAEITPELLARIPDIPAKYHESLCACHTEDDLLDAPDVPDDIKFHLIERLAETPVSEIGQKPVKVVSRPEDLNEFLEGRLSDFLLLLDESQEKVVDWALQGPTLVKGGPGSGKSTVAMYRVREVMRRAAAENRPVKVLFTTYTKSLVNVSRQLLSRLLEGLPGTWEVDTLDVVAVRHARKSGEKILDARTDENEWTSAIESQLNSGRFEREFVDFIRRVGLDFVIEEFEQVIEGRGLQSAADYVAADRTGRHVGLRANAREQLWALYRGAKQSTRSQSWGDIRTLAFNHLQATGGIYDYVIIDEAQDLTPQAIRMCIALAKSPQGVYLTADLSQSIYNRGFPLSRIAELQDATRRTRILRRNYRSTAEIVRAASEIIGLDAGDRETLAQSCVRAGPKPVLLTVSHEPPSVVASEIAGYIRRALRSLRLPLNGAAVLCRKRAQVAAIAEALTTLGMRAEQVSRGSLNLDSPSVKVITLHSAKGLEFPVVIVPYVDANVIPEIPDSTDSDAVFEVEERERRLLFVGLTRAMRRLIVTTSGGTAMSPFLESASESAWAFEFA